MILPLKDENPTSRFPVVTVVLLSLNLIVFVGQLSSGSGIPGWAGAYGYVPAAFSGRLAEGPDITGARWISVLVSMFLHGSVSHVAGNLLFLWIFGNNIEDVLGSVRFLLLYLLAGFGGHFAHFLSDPGSLVPTIGASGAISGILAAYLLRYPNARVHSLLFLVFYVRLIRIPAIVVIGLWFLQQLWQGASSLGSGASSGGVAWFEHIGGFATGLLLFPVFEGRAPWARR